MCQEHLAEAKEYIVYMNTSKRMQNMVGYPGTMASVSLATPWPSKKAVALGGVSSPGSGNDFEDKVLAP